MIERCFKCDGKGTRLVADYESVKLEMLSNPGSVMRVKCVTCDRCLGSGAVEYQILDAKPATEKKDSE